MRSMHFNMPTIMVVTTFCAAVYLLMSTSDRMFPTLAVTPGSPATAPPAAGAAGPAP